MTLQGMERFGESKYEAKRNHQMQNGIYSHSTAKAYHRDCQKFAEYVKEHGANGRYTHLNETKELAKEYLAREIESGKSAYTIKGERSALAKLFGVEGKELAAKVPERSRENITRSREHYVISEITGKKILNQSARAGHFSEKTHPDLVAFCNGTGLRRAELNHVRGDQFGIDEKGNYIIRIVDNQAKGGKERIVHVLDNSEKVRELCERAGHNCVFDKIPQSMDVHYYRGRYATNRYNSLARPINEIPPNERYYCRGDRKGEVYDRVAMWIVTHDLGHNRLNVLSEHYLRDE